MGRALLPVFGTVGALGAGAAATAAIPALPWEVVTVIIAIAMSWAAQEVRVNGYGRRLQDSETRIAHLEGKAGGLDVLANGIGGLDRRLERIEKLLDAQVKLG